MIKINFSGYIDGEPKEFTDKNGHNYIRFNVISSEKEAGKEVQVTFKCYTYRATKGQLKGEQFVTLGGKPFFDNLQSKKIIEVYVEDIYV